MTTWLGTMQKNIRFNESQLIYLVSKARRENTNAGFLYKKSSDTGKWQQRYFVLYQNMLFYFENENASRPLGVVLLEGSYCERVITPLKGKESEKQVIEFNWPKSLQTILKLDNGLSDMKKKTGEYFLPVLIRKVFNTEIFCFVFSYLEINGLYRYVWFLNVMLWYTCMLDMYMNTCI